MNKCARIVESSLKKGRRHCYSTFCIPFLFTVLFWTDFFTSNALEADEGTRFTYVRCKENEHKDKNDLNQSAKSHMQCLFHRKK